MSSRLYTPGPVPVPPAVSEASYSVLHHRSQEFLDVSQRMWANLRTVFQTTSPVAVLPGSGMTAIESAIASTVKTGDRVVVLQHGRFGERLAAINTIYGAHVIDISVAWGETITAEMVEERLSSIGHISCVWLVHSETSTGVALDVASITNAIRQTAPDALIMVDAVLSLAIQELLPDTWGIDAVATGIQKGLMCPPGLGCVSVSSRMQQRMKGVDRRSYTLDLNTVLRDAERGYFTWTPPVTLVSSLEVALGMLCAQPIRDIWEHHTSLTAHVQNLAHQRGLNIFGDGSARGVVVLQHDDAGSLVRTLETDYGIIVASGQDHLLDRTFRIGTCGSYTNKMMDELFHVIDQIVLT